MFVFLSIFQFILFVFLSHLWMHLRLSRLNRHFNRVSDVRERFHFRELFVALENDRLEVVDPDVVGYRDVNRRLRKSGRTLAVPNVRT